MGSDNYKKCAPLRCEITEDLPASKVQKDSKTSLLEGIKSSYDTLSTGNALYHDQKKLDSFYSKTQVLFEKANKIFYQLDKKKSKEIYNISRYSLSLIDLIKHQQSHIKLCMKEMGTQKEKYELLQKQIDDLNKQVNNNDEVIKKDTESLDKVKQETAIKVFQTPQPELLIPKENNMKTILFDKDSQGAPKPSALGAFLAKVAKASCKRRKPKKPIRLLQTTEDGWTKIIASYGRPIMVTKDSLLTIPTEVMDDNRYTSLMPDWILDYNREESSDDSNKMSYPLARLGMPKRQQRSKRLDKSNYPQIVSEDVNKNLESKRSIQDGTPLGSQEGMAVGTIKEGLEEPMEVTHDNVSSVKDKNSIKVEIKGETVASRVNLVKESRKVTKFNKRKESKRSDNKSYPKANKPKDAIIEPNYITRASVILRKLKKVISEKGSKKESTFKNVKIKKFINPSMKKTSNNKKPVIKKTGEKWTDKLSEKELFKICLEGKKPVENKYRLVIIGGLPEGEKHNNIAAWAAALKVKESDVPLIKDIGGNKVFLARINVIEKVVSQITKISLEASLISSDNGIRAYIALNYKDIVNNLVNIQKSWKNFVPLQKSIKVILKELRSLNTVKIKKVALDDEAIEEFRGQYDP